MSEQGVFRRRRVVNDEDVDFLGHVNNTVWVHFIVQLAEAHSSSLGFDWEATRAQGGLWIVRRHEIDYHRPAHPGQELIEETWIHSIRGARSIRHARFTLADDGSLLVSSVTQWAFCDSETQRPKRVPKELLERYPIVERD
jgi:acyl-CoA thioester hydrolase